MSELATTGTSPSAQPAESASTGDARAHIPARSQPARGTQAWWLMRAEWTKLRSVRSTVNAFLSMAVVCVGLGAAIAAGTVARWDRLPRVEHLGFEPASRSLSGLFLGQLVIGVLGCLVLSAEYSTGTIRATFSASPQRVTVLATKTAVFAVVAFAVSLVTCVASFEVGQSIYAGKSLQTTLGAPGVARVVLGGALYLTVVGLLGLGLAAILRHTAGTISTLFGLLLVVPILARFLPSDWQADINKFLPSNAGSGIFQLHPEPNMLAPWTGFALFCGYALLALILGALTLRARDA
jgi:ABC-2 type transport system permease protein